MAKHPCECCGYRTLEDPLGGTYQICPVCFWEDAPFADDAICERFSNGVSLRQAQRNYANCGAATPEFSDNVRSAEPEETRDPSWCTLDELADKQKQFILNEIDRSFQGVTRGGGVSLHETVEIDSGGLDTSQPKDNSDTGHDWRDVPSQDLADVCGIGGISFLDPIGWRYYLPAYMTWWLKEGEHSDSFAADCLIYSLQSAPDDSDGLRQYALERYEKLNPEQSETVARFLTYIRNYANDSISRKDAVEALASYWDQFIN